MTELAQPPDRFRGVARLKLADARIQGALGTAQGRLYDGRERAWGELDDVEDMRNRARDVRTRTIEDLDRHLARFTEQVEARGGHVHRCATAEEAAAKVVEISRAADAKLVAKSKSMLSEEIGLNEALEAVGIQPVETDLGEYVLQLAGEHPVHIVAPAIEKTAAEIAELFTRESGRPVGDGLEELTLTARGLMRDVFLTADVGVTGVNFAVAETGSICLTTNEGNGRLVSSLPRVHVALMGIERIVPTLDDFALMVGLLGRSATGQRLTTYTTVITGPRRAGETDGPEELHVVLVDNGRSGLRGTRYQEMLNCIRCGACLNVCPVYRKTGGSAYGPVYSGPMGAVLAPLLVGIENAPALPHASSLCGACTAACPVKIPLHELLLELRRDLVDERQASALERFGFTLWSLAWSTPVGYRLTARLARLGQALGGLAGPGRIWARGRDLPRLAARRFGGR